MKCLQKMPTLALSLIIHHAPPGGRQCRRLAVALLNRPFVTRLSHPDTGVPRRYRPSRQAQNGIGAAHLANRKPSDWRRGRAVNGSHKLHLLSCLVESKDNMLLRRDRPTGVPSTDVSAAANDLVRLDKKNHVLASHDRHKFPSPSARRSHLQTQQLPA